MAYVSNNQDQDDQNKNIASQGMVSPASGGVHLAPTSGGPTAGMGSTATGAAGNAGASQPQGAGGSFATLDKYIGANQPGSAVQNSLVDPIQGQISNAASTAQNSSNAAVSGIQNDVNAATNAVPDTAGQVQSIWNTMGANTPNPLDNPNTVQGLNTEANASYQGPVSAEADPRYTQAQSDIKAGTDLTNNLNSDAGQKQLVQGVEKVKNNAGVTALNQGLLTNDQGFAGNLAANQAFFPAVSAQLATGAQGIDASIPQAQKSVQSQAAKANGIINKQQQNNPTWDTVFSQLGQ